MSEQAKPQFNVQRIYLKDLSFESPKAPETFRKEWKPEVKMDMKTDNTKLADDNYEVVLTLTISASLAGEPAFLVEIQQAGIFLIKHFAEEQLKHALGAYCQNVLFPYARESIDSVVTKGSFPALMLAPINFDALYQQAKNKSAEQTENVQ